MRMANEKIRDEKTETTRHIASLKYLFGFILRYKWKYLAGFCFTIISASLSSITPYLIKRGIDALEHGGTKSFITYIALAVATFGLLRSITLFLGRNIIVGTGRLVEKEIREDIYRNIMKTKTEFFDKEGTGKISSRIINDVENIRMMLGFGGMIISHILFILVFSLIAEFLINMKLMLIASTPLLGIILIVVIFEKKLFERSERVQDTLSQIQDFTQERLSLIKLIKNFVLEKRTEREFVRLSKMYKKDNISLAKTYGLFEALISILSLISLLTVVVAGSKMLINGEISKGVLAGFIAYQLSLIWPAMAIGYLIVIGERGIACTSRIIWLINQKKEKIWNNGKKQNDTDKDKKEETQYIKQYIKYEYDGNGTENENEKTPAIKVIGLSYGILKNINLDIPPGTKIGIVGKTGSGKTTLLNLLMKIYEPPDNTIFLDGVDINLIDERFFRKIVAGTLQENFFFSDKIIENLLMDDFSETRFLSDADHSKLNINVDFKRKINNPNSKTLISAMLDVAEFNPSEFPKGIYEVLGEKGTKLSGGQKERLALARALIKNPKILILDDPFANVDVETETSIMKKLLTLAEERKMTIIMATQRGKILKMFDRVIILDGGEIKGDGKPEEMIRRSEFLRKVCDLVY